MDPATKFASRPDYHQLPSYGRVMERIGWKVVPLTSGQLFVKTLGPVAFAKLQRPQRVNAQELLKVSRALRIVWLVVEPGLGAGGPSLGEAGFKPTPTHYAYTKTLVVDISAQLDEVMASFSKTLKYQMRRSQKMGVTYQAVSFARLSPTVVEEILTLHHHWSREKKVMGYDDVFLRALIAEMGEGSMILARKAGKLVGAIFFLSHHRVGMYFYQFSAKEGREELYVPSGLAYQALVLAKAKHCDLFDLCSAFDERYPKENLAWKGFTRHKERFHPYSVYYPPSFQRLGLPFRLLK